jgi:hypothetical protein
LSQTGGHHERHRHPQSRRSGGRVLILAWPLLIAGGLIGAAAGWVAGRGRRPWTGAVAGMLAGVAAAPAGFVVYMSWNG